MPRRILGAVALAAMVFVAACGEDRSAEPAPADARGSSTTTVEGTGSSDPTVDEPPARVVTTPPLAELPELEPFGRAAVELVSATGDVTCSCVLVADSGAERSQGLMEVTDLRGYAGMVFVFDRDSTSSFFMQDTPMPLSIAWFDATGGLVSSLDMDPCLDGGTCPTYSATGPYRFALEVAQGRLPEVGVTPGAKLRLVDDCA